jgi:hypothetical protein
MLETLYTLTIFLFLYSLLDYVPKFISTKAHKKLELTVCTVCPIYVMGYTRPSKSTQKAYG